MPDILLATIRPLAAGKLGDQNDATYLEEQSDILQTPPAPAAYDTSLFLGAVTINDLPNALVAVSYLVFFCRVKVTDQVSVPGDAFSPVRSVIEWESGAVGQSDLTAQFVHDNAFHNYNTPHITVKPTGGGWTVAAVNALKNINAQHSTYDDTIPLGPGTWRIDVADLWVEVWGVSTANIPAPAANLLYDPSAREIRDSVRRLINDVDPDHFGIPEHVLAELLVATFVSAVHDAGPDPRLATKSTSGASMASYAIAAGSYQTAEETRNDIVAMDPVHVNTSPAALEYLDRATLEARVAYDIKTNGRVAQGTPLFWTLAVYQVAGNEMRWRLEVYPACDQGTQVYWPRALADPDGVDPQGSGRAALSYQLTQAIKVSLAAACLDRMDAAALQRNGVDPEIRLVFFEEYQAAIEHERAARATHFLADRVGETCS